VFVYITEELELEVVYLIAVWAWAAVRQVEGLEQMMVLMLKLQLLGWLTMLSACPSCRGNQVSESYQASWWLWCSFERTYLRITLSQHLGGKC